MTVDEFNAAGDQAKRAADALPTLRVLPGYVGIRLDGGKIRVEGAGAGLQSRVDELNQTGPAEFELVATAAVPESTPAPSEAPGTGAGESRTASAAELVASSTEQLFRAYVREVGTDGLQAVAYTDGRFVIRTGGANSAEAKTPAEAGTPAEAIPAGEQARQAAPAAPAPGKVSPADFVARYANVALEQGSPIATEEDLFGGQGYVTDRNIFCSAGFGAFNPAGKPVLLTAGHCAQDGGAKTASVEPRSAAPAFGAATPPAPPYAGLGTFGFSQFGGPRNSWITGEESSPGNVGTDIAVVESLRKGLNVQAAATVWGSGSADDPGATAVKIVGSVSPFQGQQVCRSGRTTGWSCGTVQELGIYVVGGTTPDPADLRAFRGFLSKDVQSSGGDSGGPWISGNFAVGTHSAGEGVGAAENFAIATTLEDSLARIPGGVQLQLFLNRPQLLAPAVQTVTAGQPVTGRVPAAPASAVAANSKVRITLAGDAPEPPLEVPVDASGNWSFPAPSSTGALRFSAETVNGFSRSGAVSLSVNVSDLDAPVITTPAEGAALKSVTRIDGTGTAGLTVKLNGDFSGSAVVAADGQWTIRVDEPAPGRYSMRAVQTSKGEADSPAVTRNFAVDAPAVVPAEPAAPTVEAAAPGNTAAQPPVLPAGSGQLPDTGAGSLLPTAGLAGGAILLGSVLLVAARRRTAS
ncbi:S1 family peptidase [Arthrobacter sp. UYCu712]|uniref:S1 family peptidase n=1 Tax=Arthrobacter sp. UYCu712 TaxID=3156340 RepID=UPI0033923DB5